MFESSCTLVPQRFELFFFERANGVVLCGVLGYTVIDQLELHRTVSHEPCRLEETCEFFQVFFIHKLFDLSEHLTMTE